MKVFIAGLTLAAAIVGGGIGYASLQIGGTGWQNAETISNNTEAEASEPKSILDRQREIRNIFKKDSEVVEETSSASANNTSERTSPSDRPVVITEPDDIVITEDELNQRVQEAIASDPQIAPLLAITEDGVNTIVTNDRVESGITINLTELPLEDLPLEVQTAVSEMTKTFPFLANRPVYLGIEGSPKIVEGAVSLDDTNVKFGPLKLPVSGVASQLGVSQTDIERQLNVVLEQQGLTPEEILIVDQQIIIKGVY